MYALRHRIVDSESTVSDAEISKLSNVRFVQKSEAVKSNVVVGYFSPWVQHRAEIDCGEWRPFTESMFVDIVP